MFVMTLSSGQIIRKLFAMRFFDFNSFDSQMAIFAEPVENLIYNKYCII